MLLPFSPATSGVPPAGQLRPHSGVLLCMFASLYDLEGERVDKMSLLVSSSTAAAAAHHWQAGVENKLSQVHGYKRPCIVIQDWKTNIIEVMSGYIYDGGPTYSMRHKGA